MGMDTPTIYRYRPAVFPTAFLAGLVASLLQVALLELGPSRVDVPRIVGGVFHADVGSAEVTGLAVMVATGVLVIPLAVTQFWRYMPGDDVTIRGAIVKAVLLAGALAVMSAVVLPVLALVGRLDADELGSAGTLALADAVAGFAWLLVTLVAYSLALALVGAMPRGISPADTVGWGWWSHGSGESP
jgi:hypothetical protein